MLGSSTSLVSVASDRTSHWVKLNHQNRMPSRWIAFDTESKSERDGDEETQDWNIGTAIRWRTDLKTGDRAEAASFDNPDTFWQWVSDYCRPGHRTVCIAHNLGHDARISGALSILPALGYRLEWCNLDNTVSSMTWRSGHGTLVFMDLWTWLPMQLSEIGLSIGLRKLNMPQPSAKTRSWYNYCMRDTEIVYRAMSEIISFIKNEKLGNWQPTGAGMAYATWRHKFMTHKVLVHDDIEALTAERIAMHTGRAEAWRHGELLGDVWTDVDMRNAYLTIASECELPVKLKMKVGAISDAQYDTLRRTYRILGLCRVHTRMPVVPCYSGGKTIWPVGTFETWLWDAEIDIAKASGGGVRVKRAMLYTKAPILQEWAKWVLSILRDTEESTSPVVRTWLKHCSRALIGRIALRFHSWDRFGDNPEHITGITHSVDADTNKVTRMLHVGSDTFCETPAREGRDSLPQITGWVMAECRARLWQALEAAGQDHVAHVDTDGLLVDRVGLARLRDAYGADFERLWQVKGSAGRVIVYGPRNYRFGTRRKASGVPRKAKEILPNVFTGEQWSSMARDLGNGHASSVTVVSAKWELTKKDPRRLDAPGVDSYTVPIQLDEASVAASSSSPRLGSGA